MAKATSDLIHAARSKTVEFGANEKVPAIMKQLRKAGTTLHRRGPEAGFNEWQRSMRRIERYANRLAKDGRMRANLLEVLQNERRNVGQSVDDITRHWMADKQRYNAERIIKTEQQIAFKNAQISRDAEVGFIIGYIWKMNRGARRNFVKTVKLRKNKKFGGRRRRCICEELDGKQISIEEAKARPIGHPHCMCSLIPVYGRGSLTTVSAAELAEFS
jgi:hypothetical protein